MLLRAARHLLILDNAESITAAPAAIPHAIDPGEQVLIRTLLARLARRQDPGPGRLPRGRGLAGTGTFGDNVYPLPGLDPQAASILTDRILRRHHAAGWLDDDAERQALHDLTSLLGGYPLPMTVVLPALAAAPPSQVLADLQAGDPAAGPSRADHRGDRIQPRPPRSRPAGILAASCPLHRRHPARQVATGLPRCVLLQDAAPGLPARRTWTVPSPRRSGSALPPRTLSWTTGCRSSRSCPTSCVPACTIVPLSGMLPPAPTTSTACAWHPAGRAAARTWRPPGADGRTGATRAEYANLTTALAWGLRAGQPVR